MSTRTARSLVIAAAGFLLVAGCSTSSQPDTPATTAAGTPQSTPAPQPAEPSATVDVYAAASLTNVFTELADQFHSEHPSITISLTFAGSQDLASQINEGAPADVFASADERNMELVANEVASPATIFASNTLTIVVPAGNPAHIEGLASLAEPGVLVVVCAPSVPCGAATERVTQSQGVTLSPASEESNVTDVLGKVSAGEADAGLVYVTDVARASGVESVHLDGAEASLNRYPIAALTTGDAPDAAQLFVDFVLSDAGRAVLAAAGFQLP